LDWKSDRARVQVNVIQGKAQGFKFNGADRRWRCNPLSSEAQVKAMELFIGITPIGLRKTGVGSRSWRLRRSVRSGSNPSAHFLLQSTDRICPGWLTLMMPAGQ